MRNLLNKTWELGSNYSIAHTGIEVVKQWFLKKRHGLKINNKNIEFVGNENANYLNKVTDKEKRKEKPFILKMQYGKHFNTFKHTTDHLCDQPNTQQIKDVSKTKTITSFISTKCPTFKGCQAYLVYQFKKPVQQKPLIGESKRHLQTSLADHRQKSRDNPAGKLSVGPTGESWGKLWDFCGLA